MTCTIPLCITTGIRFGLKYRFNLKTWGTPDPTDVRCDLPKQALEQMKSDMHSAIQENALKSNKDLWRRLHKCLERLSKVWSYKDNGKLGDVQGYICTCGSGNDRITTVTEHY